MSHVTDDFMGEGYAVDGPSIQRFELLVREEVAVHEKGKSIQNEISLPEQLQQKGDKEGCTDQFQHQSFVVIKLHFEVLGAQEKQG